MSTNMWEEEVEYVHYEEDVLGKLFAPARHAARQRARELAHQLLSNFPELPDPVLESLHPDQPMPTVRQGIRQARQILTDRLAS